MKRIILLLLLTVCINSFAQTHEDSTKLFRQTASLYDLDFSQAEADSMTNNLIYWKSIYLKMHQQLPKNDLHFPLLSTLLLLAIKFPPYSRK